MTNLEISKHLEMLKTDITVDTVTVSDDYLSIPRSKNLESYQDIRHEGLSVPSLNEWNKVVEGEKLKGESLYAIKQDLHPEYENKNYEFLYSTDDLVSNKITWNDTRVKVKFYNIKDIYVPWWKFWISKVDIVNKKNIDLWHEACAVAKAKKLSIPGPPCKYGY